MAAVTENNWLGRGIKLSTQLDLTEETISGFLNVSNPNFNYSGNSVDASVSVSSSDMTKTAGYESSRTGFSLGTGFEQFEGIFLSPGFAATYEDIEVETSSSSAVKKMDGTYYNLDFNSLISCSISDNFAPPAINCLISLPSISSFVPPPIILPRDKKV